MSAEQPTTAKTLDEIKARISALHPQGLTWAAFNAMLKADAPPGGFWSVAEMDNFGEIRVVTSWRVSDDVRAMVEAKRTVGLRFTYEVSGE